MVSAKGATYNMHMLNNVASTQAFYADQAILTAANMATATPVVETNGAKVTGGAATVKGTVLTATDAGVWVVDLAKSLSTIAAADAKTASMTLTLTKVIKTNFAAWTRKESMTMGCGGA